MYCHDLFATLEKNHLKGAHGTVLVIGGSSKYTGAPVFSGNAALRSGSELVYIMPNTNKLDSFKVFYEAIVLPIKFNKRLCKKITACIVGPGLGRPSKTVLQSILSILAFLNEQEVPIIVDADAIHFYKMGCFDFVGCCIVTPNINESRGLQIKPGHICIYKGHVDRIVMDGKQHEIRTPGSYKRIAGSGDILTGIIATMMSLSKNTTFENCIFSCEVLREACSIGFTKYSFGLVATDLFSIIPLVLSQKFKKHETSGP
ncbi:ATP-dependent NAD(P)H-hydrate dehydratase [Enteropsectra breve]|nr:ATP-dependent NAD(P)H-hydrate dehydratase [Enteropsectra breve]